MSVQPTSVRPGGGRLAAIVFLGPLVGTILGVGGLLLADPPDANLMSDGEFFLVILSFGYLFGIVPALLAALLYWLLYPAFRHLGQPQHVLICLALGAICGAVGIILVVSTFENRLTIAMPITTLGAFSGAVALAATSLPFRKRLP